MKRSAFVISVGLLAALAGCGGGDSGNDEPLDANGAYDVRTNEIFNMFGAINQECTAEGVSVGRPGTQQECNALCDCSIAAVAKLESRASAPELTTACHNYCNPNFTSTDELDVHEADADNEPDYDKFYLAYILKCDEVGHDVTFASGDATSECMETCECLADTIDKYSSPDDAVSFRSTCETQCGVSFTSEKVAPSGAEIFLKGGMFSTN